MSVFGGYKERRHGAPAGSSPWDEAPPPRDATCSLCQHEIAAKEFDAGNVEWPPCGHFGHRRCPGGETGLANVKICPECYRDMGRPAEELPPVPAEARRAMEDAEEARRLGRIRDDVERARNDAEYWRMLPRTEQEQLFAYVFENGLPPLPYEDEYDEGIHTINTFAQHAENGEARHDIAVRFAQRIQAVDAVLFGDDELNALNVRGELIQLREMTSTDDFRNSEPCMRMKVVFDDIWNSFRRLFNLEVRGEADVAPEPFVHHVGNHLYKMTGNVEAFASSEAPIVGGPRITLDAHDPTSEISSAGIDETDFAYVLRMSTRKLLRHGVFYPPDVAVDPYTNQYERDVDFFQDGEISWVPFLDATRRDFVETIDEITVKDTYDQVYHWYAEDPTSIVMLEEDWAVENLDEEKMRECVYRVHRLISSFALNLPGPPKIPTIDDVMNTFVRWNPRLMIKRI